MINRKHMSNFITYDSQFDYKAIKFSKAWKNPNR